MTLDHFPGFPSFPWLEETLYAKENHVILAVV